MKTDFEMAIRAEKLGTGQIRVFRSAGEAASALGASASAVSRALTRGSVCRGCLMQKVLRLWAVKDTEGAYMLCKRNLAGEFSTVGHRGGPVFAEEIVTAVEITKNMWGDYGR